MARRGGSNCSIGYVAIDVDYGVDSSLLKMLPYQEMGFR
jgi:hypothetical protein